MLLRRFPYQLTLRVADVVQEDLGSLDVPFEVVEQASELEMRTALVQAPLLKA